MDLQVYPWCKNPRWEKHLERYNEELSRLNGFGCGKSSAFKLVINDCTQKWMEMGGVFLDRHKNKINYFKALSFVKKALRASKDRNRAKTSALKVPGPIACAGTNPAGPSVGTEDDNNHGNTVGNDLCASFDENSSTIEKPAMMTSPKLARPKLARPKRKSVLPNGFSYQAAVARSTKKPHALKQEQPKKSLEFFALVCSQQKPFTDENKGGES
ncbi:unnamed protein product [Cylindrotheca closterium]|uniref:Uncharacterized protein n=1 Tax=Cylindrotheca closterium TaxID=2856 RepID=A0AAD2PVW6_9STRA|nr:unnamed protein product [Cylindrotheca closterium]